ncbi:DUF5043 domain-containing protein [Bacteroides intestinalis]|jgi:hypothetical protein|uniref:DUF5043 domain-containing protein n=1 Tax=Bacteroides intestinalis TaxID=329854 RepID=UPI00189E72C2|nr:DUF5043 domain-containing protein [Bacteroides intestinalis]
MKTLLFTISILLLGITEGFSQTLTKLNYYEETKTFVKDGYTYQCDVPVYKLITLYNKENKWTYEDMIYKSTGKYYAPSISEEKKLNPIIDDKEMTQKVLFIVDNAFTKDMTKEFGENRLHTTMYLDPNTGKVVEVNFQFTTFSPYAQIPLSVYRNIEIQLKEKISYTPTEVGKQLNYIMLSWGQIPKGYKPFPTIDSTDELLP